MVFASSNSNGANTDQAGISYDETDPDIDEQFNLPLAFQERWHKEKIVSGASVAPTWRMKERVGGDKVAILWWCLT